jgi:hypothetical protein
MRVDWLCISAQAEVQAVRSSELLAAPPRGRPCCALAPRRPRLPAARLRAAVGAATAAACRPLLLHTNPFAARRTQVLKRYFTPASAAVAEAALVRVVTGRSAERGGLSPVASAGPGSPGARARASRACTEPADKGRLPVDFPPCLPISPPANALSPHSSLSMSEGKGSEQAAASGVLVLGRAELVRGGAATTGLPGTPAGSSGAVKHAETPQSSTARGACHRSRPRRRRRRGADPERGGRPAQPRGGRRGARGRLRAELAAQRARAAAPARPAAPPPSPPPPAPACTACTAGSPARGAGASRLGAVRLNTLRIQTRGRLACTLAAPAAVPRLTATALAVCIARAARMLPGQALAA